jgi:hypothetical protein
VRFLLENGEKFLVYPLEANRVGYFSFSYLRLRFAVLAKSEVDSSADDCKNYENYENVYEVKPMLFDAIHKNQFSFPGGVYVFFAPARRALRDRFYS